MHLFHSYGPWKFDRHISIINYFGSIERVETRFVRFCKKCNLPETIRLKGKISTFE